MNEKLNKIKELLSSLLVEEEEKDVLDEDRIVKYGSITTETAILYWDGEEELKEGDLVYTADEEGENKVQAEDGEYKVPDTEVIYKVENGRVAEIVIPEVEPEVEPEPEPETEPEPEVNAEDEDEEEPAPAPEEPAGKEEEKPAEEEKRDLEKEIDELKELVAELQRKLEAVEKEKPNTPSQEFEAIHDEPEMSMAEKYAAALRK